MGDACRGSGVDHVAGVQRHEPGDVADQLGDAADQVRRRVALTLLAVDVGGQGEVRRVDLVGADQERAERVERLAVLALVPLPAALDLEVALGHVVGDRVAGDVRQGIGVVREVASGRADDDGEFDLVIGRRTRRWDPHVVVGADHRVRSLHEQHRFGRDVGVRLGGVGRVVEPDAHDLAGAGYGWADADAVEGHDRQSAGSDGRSDLRQSADRRGVEIGDDPRQVERLAGRENGDRTLPAGLADPSQLHVRIPPRSVHVQIHPMSCGTEPGVDAQCQGQPHAALAAIR